jgi:hypothetical protein
MQRATSFGNIRLYDVSMRTFILKFFYNQLPLELRSSLSPTNMITLEIIELTQLLILNSLTKIKHV